MLALLCLISSCSEKMICPAYQSVFILDDNYRERYFSPFEMVAGDTLPKGRHDIQKRRSDSFVARIWTRPERPVLENPYLMARIFNKRPYWKLDVIKPELVHYVNRDTVQLGEVALDDSTQLNQPVQTVLTLPQRYPNYNQEQFEYNKRFGHLFPRPPRPPDPADTTATLDEFLSDTLATDSTKRKKGIFGLFNKKNKPPKPKREKKKNRKKNNDEGTKGEEDNL